MLVHNKKARHKYKLEGDTLEVGISLHGTEVKSIRQNEGGNVSLDEAYVAIIKGNLSLLNAYIAPYSHGTHANHEPRRERRLLAHKNQIIRLAQQVEISGFTLIPLGMYFKEGRLKLLISLGKGKQQHDRRHELRDKAVAKDFDRQHKLKL